MDVTRKREIPRTRAYSDTESAHGLSVIHRDLGRVDKAAAMLERVMKERKKILESE